MIQTRLKINDKYHFYSKLKLQKAEQKQLILNVKETSYFLTCLDEMKEHWDKTKINISFDIPTKKMTSLALLRIGYLLSFYYLGYSIIFEQNIHKIRKAIIESDMSYLPHAGVLILPDNQSINEGLQLLISPEDCRSFFIILKIKIKSHSKVVAIPIPGPKKEGWTNYCQLSNLEKGIQLTFRNFTSNDYIQNPRLVNAYDYLFENG